MNLTVSCLNVHLIHKFVCNVSSRLYCIVVVCPGE